MNELPPVDDPAAFAATRRAWHAVAELVLAGPQYRESGTIRLRVAEGGFATIAEPPIAVLGGELIAPGVRLPIDGHSCAALAAAIGVAVGKPENLYSDGSDLGADTVLRLDSAAVGRLTFAFACGDEALRRLAPAQTPVLWPEHFDVAVTLDEVNYGVSAGDGYLAEPYAYVGPWQPREGDFWTAPFGAAKAMRELPDVDSVFAFFARGRALSQG